MALTFVSASLHSLDLEPAPLTAPPFSISGWFNHGAAVEQYPVFLGDKDVTNQFHYIGFATNQTVFAGSRAGSVGQAESTSQATEDEWAHVLGVWAAADARAVYLDGGSKGTNSTNLAPSGVDRFSLGALRDDSASDFWEGLIAEVAVWSVALTDAEAVWLATGASPLTLVHRLSNLVLYKPLIRSANGEFYNIGGNWSSVDVGAVAAHPRVMYPRPVASSMSATPGAASAGRPKTLLGVGS